MNPDDTLLCAWLSGALDPGRAWELEARLRRSTALQARLAELSAELQATPIGRPAPRWRLPIPPRSLGTAFQAVGMMGGAAARFRLELSPPEGARRLVVLLGQEPPQDWRVLFPLEKEEQLWLEELPRHPDGRAWIELGLEKGLERAALVIAEEGWEPDWSADLEPRWRPLRQAVEEGRGFLLVQALPRPA
jgi:hypothetical protein